MKSNLATIASVVVLSLTTLGSYAFAQASGSSNAATPNKPADRSANQQGHRGPPKEAVEACRTLSAGAPCSFTGPQANRTGNCWAPDAQHPLACKPEKNPTPAGR